MSVAAWGSFFNSLKIWLDAGLRWRVWILILGPLVWPALEAWRQGHQLPLGLWLSCVGVGFLIQQATHLWNDYADFVQGVDLPDRQGPARLCQIRPEACGWVRLGAWVCIVAAFLWGAGIVWYTKSVWALGVGILSLLLAYGYSLGPLVLSRWPITEFLAFFFFGIIPAVLTGSLIKLPHLLPVVVLGSLSGFYAFLAQLANNWRDQATDARAGRLTLPIFLGSHGVLKVWQGGWVAIGLLGLSYAFLAWPAKRAGILALLWWLTVGWPPDWKGTQGDRLRGLLKHYAWNLGIWSVVVLWEVWNRGLG